MCGIFGYFSRSGAPLAADKIAAMGKRITHRGPDDAGIYSEPGIALGNQRLSIIDIAGGHQPFVSEDGQVIVVQNGEIFNHVELAKELAESGHPCRTHCDTEVLLRLYERDGIEFLPRLNGMFAIAIWDRRIDEFFLVRDRIGVKPLYVADDGDRLVFGSEIKAMLPALSRDPEFDLNALHHYLTFNYVPPPLTIRRGIRHLMPGCVMKVTRAETSTKRWWSLADVAPEYDRSEESWIEEFNAILTDAVRIRMRSDVPFGAFLSGGVDSSTIVGLMAQHQSDPIKTFCIGFDDPKYDEAPFAQAAANRFGTHHVMERVDPDMLDLWPMAIRHCDQPHGDISFLPTFRVSQLAVQQVKVVLTGDGGDELFAGYDKYRDFFYRPGLSDLSDEQFQRDYFSSISLFSDAEKLGLYNEGARSALGGSDPFDMAQSHFADVPHQDRVNQALYVDMQLLLSGNNLVKPDRMGMAVSLEARTPFLDVRMMEFAFRMPGNLKLKNDVTKYLYKKAVAPLIGEDLAYRRKQMFTVPVGDWFRDRLKTYCEKHIADLTQSSDIFESKRLDALLASHLDGSRNATREIRSLLALNIHRASPIEERSE